MSFRTLFPSLSLIVFYSELLAAMCSAKWHFGFFVVPHWSKPLMAIVVASTSSCDEVIEMHMEVITTYVACGDYGVCGRC
jgi:hypothetical protein